MRPTRLVLAALLTAAIVPGTWLRTAEPPQDFQRFATLEPIDVTQSQRGPFTLMAGWELTGDRAQFGGFSALVVLDKERFLAGSDTGQKLIFGRPDRSDLPAILSSFDDANDGPKESRDLESLAIDPSSGILWGGYEFREAIVRFDSAHRRNAEVRPPQMRNWESNGGAESLARLSDGRFLVIEESAQRWMGRQHEALIFATDPIEDKRPQSVLIDIPQSYSPVDATPIGGGRALILLRRLAWSIPPGFETAIVEIDIDRRNADGSIPTRLLAEFGNAIPRDNYEGIAVTTDDDGQFVWLISDDNFMAIQRTLLLKLRWDRREKARE